MRADNFLFLIFRGSNKKCYHPVEIPLFRSFPVVCLSSGDFHMLALCRVAASSATDGHSSSPPPPLAVYSWGYGADGQTGHSTLFNIRTPRRLDALDNADIISVQCGSSWSTATSKTGVLYTWGYGDAGWLGLKRPHSMPFYDCDTMEIGDRIGEQHVHIRSFDSRHTVVRPTPLRYLLECGFAVDTERTDGINGSGGGGGGAVRTGGAHMILFCKPLDGGTTAGSVRATTIVPDPYGSAGDTTSNEEDDKDSGNKLKGQKLSLASDAKTTSSKTAVNSAIDKKASSSSSSSSFSSTSNTASSTTRRHVNTIFEENAKVNLPYGDSRTSAMDQLMQSCRQGDVRELERLLQSPHLNLSANSRDAMGNTPLIAACQSGQTAVCEVLARRFQADLNQSNHSGNTPLHYCFSFGHDRTGQVLINLGADEFLTNKNGLTCYEGLTHSDLENI